MASLREFFTRFRVGKMPDPRAELPITSVKDEIVTGMLDGDSSLYGQFNRFRQLSDDRQIMYEAYDDMKTDSVIAAALEIYADDATQTDENGRVVWVESEDENITKAANRLLDIFEIPERAWKHVYMACLYGDYYLKLYRHDYDDSKEKDEVLNPNQVHIVNDVVDYKGHKDIPEYDEYVEDVRDPATIFDLRKRGKTAGFVEIVRTAPETLVPSVTPNYNSVILQFKDIQVYRPDRLIHIMVGENTSRIPETVSIDLGDGTTVEYESARGKSVLQDVYPIQKELQLLEDSLLLNRLTRSALIRILEVELGDMPKKEVNNYTRRLKQIIEQHISLDKDNGKYKSFNAPGPIDNVIYIPVRNGKGHIDINNLGGDVNIRDIADIDYFNNKRAGALKIPRGYLGDDMEGCLRGSTKLLLLSGKHRTIKEMYDNREEYLGKGIMSCNEDGEIVPTIIKDIKLTRKNADFVRVHLDNGEYFDVTPDHLVMLRDGTFAEAFDLDVGESLMPLYDKVSEGRRYVWDNKEEVWWAQYRLVAQYKYGELLKGHQIHHINEIKIDDDPSNLEQITIAEHCHKHSKGLHKKAEISRQELKEKNPDLYYEIYGRGGRSLKGKSKKEKTRKKISEALKGKPSNHPFEKGEANPVFHMSEETHMKLSESHKGKRHTEETKRKIGEAHKGKVVSEETKRKLRENRPDFSGENNPMYGRSVEWTEERKNAQSERYQGEGNPFYGKHHTDETKEKIREARKNLSPESRQRMSEAQKNRPPITDEGRENHSNAVKGEKNPCYGKKKVNNGTVQKFIPKNEVEQFLLDNPNWELGGLKKSAPHNHKVVKVEYLEGIIEDAYDIEVENACPTFILDAGVFVHNSGLSNGGSLTRLSIRYARTIKRIQQSYIRAITTLLNLFFVDKNLDYVNKFQVRMTSPSTQEDLERNELINGNIDLVSNIMDLTDSLEGGTQKKILNYLVANIMKMPEVATMIEEDTTPEEEISIDGGGGAGGPDIDIDVGGPGLGETDISTDFEEAGSEGGPESGGFSEEDFSEFEDTV